MKAQQAERQPPVLSRPPCQGLSRIPSTHHASRRPPRLEMRSHGGEVDLPKATQIEVRLESLPRPGSGQSQWTLFSVGPGRSPFNVNLGLGANLTRWRHPDPCSLAWPVDKEQRGSVPRAGSGQAGLRWRRQLVSYEMRQTSCPSGLRSGWAGNLPFSLFSSFTHSGTACLAPSLRLLHSFCFPFPFPSLSSSFLPGLCFPFTLSCSRPHPHSYCGNNSMPEIKAGSS